MDEETQSRMFDPFFITFSGKIDLALFDIKLPDIPGYKVYTLIMEARPGLKVIVSSGYSIDDPTREILDEGAEGFITKPFSVRNLQRN
jgi:two-component system, cell cycle sensor histidine kinase and response regulator CckA